MKHRILVLGAGYAGAFSAGLLSRRLDPADTEITVVNPSPVFVERLRLHQVAAGQDIRPRPLAEVFDGTGVRLQLGYVAAVDPVRRSVTVTAEGHNETLEYDTLVYAIGSAVADHGVPGVAEHAHHVTNRDAALRLRDRLDGLAEGAKVLVVGEGLTGIETVTEIAESRPGLDVAFAARGIPGAWLSERAQQHLRRCFERLGITVHEHTDIAEVGAGGATRADGTVLEADATVWTAGFAVSPLATEAGFAVADDGRILVDDTMRSVSHPDVYAIGDTVHAVGENGRPLPMSCASAGFTAQRAVAGIVEHLTGHALSWGRLAYVGNHISLGRKDAIVQMVDGTVTAKSWALTGRTAAYFKALVLKGSVVGTANPTFGVPVRKRRIAEATREVLSA